MKNVKQFLWDFTRVLPLLSVLGFFLLAFDQFIRATRGMAP